MKVFWTELAKQLIGNFSSQRKRERPSDEQVLLARHVERHFPDFLPLNEKGKEREKI